MSTEPTVTRDGNNISITDELNGVLDIAASKGEWITALGVIVTSNALRKAADLMDEHARSADDELLRRHGIEVFPWDGGGTARWIVTRDGNAWYDAGWDDRAKLRRWGDEAEARTFAIEQARKLEAEANR